MTKQLAWASKFYWLNTFERGLNVILDNGNDDCSFGDCSFGDCSVEINGVASFPAYLENAEKILLVGPSPDSEMRLLFLPHIGRYESYSGPIEIKTIPLSFANLRSRLDEAWQVKFGVPYSI